MEERVSLTDHISQSYDDELVRLYQKLLDMASEVESQLRDALRALLQNDTDAAKKVIQYDININKTEQGIDAECIRIIARRQPVARDLRFIIATLKISSELERIGDLAERLASNSLEIYKEHNSTNAHTELKHLGELTKNIYSAGLRTLANLSAQEAVTTIIQDEDVNSAHETLLRLLITHMMEDPRMIRQSLALYKCARALERIGDHTKNICESVVYAAEGEDIRYKSLDEVRYR